MERPMARGTAGMGRPAFGGSIVEPPEPTPTLADIGIDKKTSMRAQQLAAMPPERFAQVASGQISVSQATAPASKISKPMSGPKADSIREELRIIADAGLFLLGRPAVYVFPCFTGLTLAL